MKSLVLFVWLFCSVEEKRVRRFAFLSSLVRLFRSSCSSKTLLVSEAVAELRIADTAAVAPTVAAALSGFFRFLAPGSFFREWVRLSCCSVCARWANLAISCSEAGRMGMTLLLA